MHLPDGRRLIVSEDVLPEPTGPGGRIVLWIRGDLDGGYRNWERVGTVGHAEPISRNGIRAAAAASTPARRWEGGRASGLLRKFLSPEGGRRWTMPGGGTAEQHGPRSEGLALAWADDPAQQLDEGPIRLLWEGAGVRPLGPGFYLVSGIAAEVPPVAWLDDPARSATAAMDLGLARIKCGDPAGGGALLEEALGAARQLGERKVEIDALLGIGLASLGFGELGRARDSLAIAFDLSRDSGDLQAEKAALERLGRVHLRFGDHPGALNLFERAMAIAAALGDRKLEADLLWRTGIELAELGRRDRAISRASEAVGLMERLGRPDAAWYAHHLANYRSSGGPAGLLAVLPRDETGATIGDGPGLLRMAYTAAGSIAKFVGSGFKATDPEAYRERLAACSGCEHHTGLRCRACGCFTAAKARLLHERRPVGKWPVRLGPSELNASIGG